MPKNLITDIVDVDLEPLDMGPRDLVEAEGPCLACDTDDLSEESAEPPV